MANTVAFPSIGDEDECDLRNSSRRQTMVHMAAFKYNTISAQSLISSIDFSDDGLHGLSAHRDHKLRLYDVGTAVMRDRITLLAENYGDHVDDMNGSESLIGVKATNKRRRRESGNEQDNSDTQMYHTVNSAFGGYSHISDGSYFGCSTARFTHSSNIVAFTPLTKDEAPVCLLNVERGVVVGTIQSCSRLHICDSGTVKTDVPYTTTELKIEENKQNSGANGHDTVANAAVKRVSSSVAASRNRYRGAMAVHSDICPSDDMIAVARADGSVMLCDPSIPRPLFVLGVHQNSDLPPPSSPLASMYFSMCPRANYVSFSPAGDGSRYVSISRPFLGVELHDRRKMTCSLSEYKFGVKSKPPSLVTSITQSDVSKMWKNNGILSQEVYSHFSSVQLGANRTAICCLGDGRSLQLEFEHSKGSCSPLMEYSCYGELDQFYWKRQDTQEVGGDGMEAMLNLDGTPPCCGALFTQPENPSNSKIWQGTTRSNVNFNGSCASLLYEPTVSGDGHDCKGRLTHAVFPVDMGPTNTLAVNPRFQIVASATRCLNWWAIMEEGDTSVE